MSGFYQVVQGTPAQRAAVVDEMPRLAELSTDVGEAAVTAWVSAWTSSSHPTLRDMPYSLQAPTYGLADHVNEVADIGLNLADYARERWSLEVDRDLLLAALLLHDVDKALLYRGCRGEVVRLNDSGSRLPHGVLGALLVKEAGLPDLVVDAVGTHATTSSVRIADREAWILHYADLFACDHAFALTEGTVPYFQRIG